MVQPKKKELAQALNRSDDDNKYQWVPFTVYTVVSQLTAQLFSPSTVRRGNIGALFCQVSPLAGSAKRGC